MDSAHKIAKRSLDLLIAGTGLVLLMPVCGAIALAIRLSMREPALFRQKRPGYQERPFTLYKFRTMRTGIDSRGNPLPDSERMTCLGKFLRNLSLDEIPQLWNVVRGDMSLVGPRPLLMEYLQRYSPHQRRRHGAKPGVTGWAQVLGRNGLSWEEKFNLDVWYVDHWNFWLDLKILCLTVPKVLKQEGVSQKGHATMPEFTGLILPKEPHQ